MSLSTRIAAVLAPHLGAQSADVVSRHICAKFGVEETATAQQMEQLTEFLRRGLVAYVGTDKAKDLATQCAQLGGA